MYTHRPVIACGAFQDFVFSVLAVDTSERGFFLSPGRQAVSR
jgi:hypothetical protein